MIVLRYEEHVSRLIFEQTQLMGYLDKKYCSLLVTNRTTHSLIILQSINKTYGLKKYRNVLRGRLQILFESSIIHRQQSLQIPKEHI